MQLVAAPRSAGMRLRHARKATKATELTLIRAALMALRSLMAQLAARLMELDQRLEQGDIDAWPAFLATIEALAAVLPVLSPERRGQLLTTAQMAAKFNVSPHTLLRRVKTGQVHPAIRLGTRG